MNETRINWTELTWNPATGCTKVSPECKHCYAKAIADRLAGSAAFPKGFQVMERPWKLGEPRKIRGDGSLIFTNSMTDFFHEKISDSYRDKIVEVIAAHPQHRFQILTKRTGAAVKYFSTRAVPRNVWLGATIGVQGSMGRLAELLRVDAAVRFLSCEPLLGPLSFPDLSGVHWVIGGGESGPHAMGPEGPRRFLVERRGDRWVPREDRIPWARGLRDQVKAAGAAFWWKQWGGPRPESGGKELDGRVWHEMPMVEGAMPGRRLPVVG